MSTIVRVVVVCSTVTLVQSLSLRHNGSSKVGHVDGKSNGTDNATQRQAQQPSPSAFTDWYYGHANGRGIWKWDNALRAYQGNFLSLAASGRPLKIAEIGVQSGGSLLMWKSVFGPSTMLYGFDINPACQQFADASTTVTIGDQADPKMWSHFFSATVSTLDILVDDGGHTPVQMRNTLYYTFGHINPGGFVAIEDIHGRGYLESFFSPAAQYIGNWHSQGMVASVHLYPFLLMVKKGGGPEVTPPPAATTVSDFAALWAALPANRGQTISVQNPAWGSLLFELALRGIFQQFVGLHDYTTYDVPHGCSVMSGMVATQCANYVTNSNAQATIIGVDVYPNQFLVHVAGPQPPVIQAVRMGNEWQGY